MLPLAGEPTVSFHPLSLVVLSFSASLSASLSASPYLQEQLDVEDQRKRHVRIVQRFLQGLGHIMMLQRKAQRVGENHHSNHLCVKLIEVKTLKHNTLKRVCKKKKKYTQLR